MNTFQELKNEFPRMEENVSLKNFSSFRIGGLAKYLLRTSDAKELKKAIEKSIELHLPFYILGKGSNTLISDKGFDGLIIVYAVKDLSREKFQLEKEKSEDGSYFIKIDATVPFSYIVNELQDFTGLEWAIGIPGVLGGAVNGNAGAFNQSISNSVHTVSAIDASGNKVKEREFSNKECQFGYRTSIFKNNHDLIATSVVLRLEKADKKEVRKTIDDNLLKRKEKLPQGFSVGSIFKNYNGSISESLLKSFPGLNDFSKKGIIPAGFLIDKCNLKEKTIGGAKISSQHANVIINFNNAKAEDVIELINLIKKSVKEKFSIDLKEEIQFLGDFAIDK